MNEFSNEMENQESLIPFNCALNEDLCHKAAYHQRNLSAFSIQNIHTPRLRMVQSVSTNFHKKKLNPN